MKTILPWEPTFPSFFGVRGYFTRISRDCIKLSFFMGTWGPRVLTSLQDIEGSEVYGFTEGMM